MKIENLIFNDEDNEIFVTYETDEHVFFCGDNEEGVVGLNMREFFKVWEGLVKHLEDKLYLQGELFVLESYHIERNETVLKITFIS